MSTLAEPYPTETALAEHSKTEFAAWVAEHKLPKPRTVALIAGELDVEMRRIEDVYAYAQVLGLPSPQPRAHVHQGRLRAYLPVRNGVGQVRVPRVPIPVYVVYREA